MKRALVISYHLKNSMRIGGFHYFIKFLNAMGYEVDWFTNPVSISWLWKREDRANARNFFQLQKGQKEMKNGSAIYNFGVPLYIPARAAKLLKLKVGTYFWPSWKRVRRRLKDSYDVILVEGNNCQYALDIKRDYPQAKIIFRISDIMGTFSTLKNTIAYEKRMIRVSDIVWCVDEGMMGYYLRNQVPRERLSILRNPFCTAEDIAFMKSFVPQECRPRKSVVYVGVSFFNFAYIEYAAKKNPDSDFIIIGPFHKKSHGNIYYKGSMVPEEFEKILSTASVAMVQVTQDEFKSENGIRYGYTRKVISYMKYLLPIVANCSSNYRGIDGFYCVDTKEEFSSKIHACLRMGVEERIRFREGFEEVMGLFLEDRVQAEFERCIELTAPGKNARRENKSAPGRRVKNDR